ncbi:MAG: hypothetical protein PF904_03640 [Kiritimatiellae bacterium]|nr:hypothetical protein [Kiritimatiellia bacterium]
MPIKVALEVRMSLTPSKLTAGILPNVALEPTSVSNPPVKVFPLPLLSNHEVTAEPVAGSAPSMMLSAWYHAANPAISAGEMAASWAEPLKAADTMNPMAMHAAYLKILDLIPHLRSCDTPSPVNTFENTAKRTRLTFLT